MSDERRRMSDIQDDDLDGRRVDRWPVGMWRGFKSNDPPPDGSPERALFDAMYWYNQHDHHGETYAKMYEALHRYAMWPADPLDRLIEVRGCEGTP